MTVTIIRNWCMCLYLPLWTFYGDMLLPFKIYPLTILMWLVKFQLKPKLQALKFCTFFYGAMLVLFKNSPFNILTRYIEF